MVEQLRETGVVSFDNSPWGRHSCHFYLATEDLSDILVPFFKAGLENNQSCLWVTSEPLKAAQAKAALNQELKGLDGYIKDGRITIIDYCDWFPVMGEFNLDKVLSSWIEEEKAALRKGWAGLRFSLNTSWVGKDRWKDLVNYEVTLNNVIGQYKMLAICSYSLDKCPDKEIIDIVSSHQFSLIREFGKWVCVENSERRRVEDEIAVLRQEVEFVLGTTKTGLDIIDAEFNVMYVNREWQKIYGDYRGRKCYEYFNGRDSLCPTCAIPTAIKIKRMVITEQVLPKELGRAVMVTTIPFQDERGKWLVAEVSVDITERRKAEEALRRSENKFRAIFENAIDGMLLINLTNQKVLMGNKMICGMLGYSSDEIKNIRLEDIYPRNDASYIMEQLEEQVKKGLHLSQNIPVKRKDGSVLYAAVNSSAITVGEKEPYLLCIFRDCTERNKIENVLRRSKEALEGQKLALEQKNIALKELIEHIERTKNNLKEDIAVNVNEIILPILQRIKLKGATSKYVDVVRTHLEDLVSSYGSKITERNIRLTPREIEICNMLKGGFTSKELSEILNTSHQTIDKHRRNIRKKLGLSNKKVNLTSFLQKL